VNTTKLKEALVELQQQRAILDGAIKNIQNVLSALHGGEPAPHTAAVVAGKASYIDLGVQVFEATGQPLHILEVCRKMSDLRGEKLQRGNVESSFIRHIKTTAERARIAKFGPSTYGLPTWPNRPASR